MLIVYSQNGVPVRLIAERWQHITHRHPEMAEQREQVLGVGSSYNEANQEVMGFTFRVTPASAQTVSG
jgi:hypothetical protein